MSRASHPRHFRMRGILDPVLAFCLRPDVHLNGDFAVHTHEFCELVMVRSGQALHVTGEGEYPIGSGDVFVTLPGRLHGYREAESLRRTIVMFDPVRYLSRLEELRRLPGFHSLFVLEPRYRERHRFESRLRLRPAEMEATADLVTRLQHEIEQRDAGYETMVLATFQQLIVYLARCYAGSTRVPSRELLRLGETLSLIETRWREPLHLPDLARQAGLSPNQFLRVFKRVTGFTPIDYLLRTRISRARELLAQGQMSVTEVAFAVGFSDSNYFARQFRRVTGTAPREHLKQEHGPRQRSGRSPRRSTGRG